MRNTFIFKHLDGHRRPRMLPCLYVGDVPKTKSTQERINYNKENREIGVAKVNVNKEKTMQGKRNSLSHIMMTDCVRI